MFFNHYINLWVFHDIQGFRLEKLEQPAKKLNFYIVVSHGNSGNKVENGHFLI